MLKELARFNQMRVNQATTNGALMTQLIDGVGTCSQGHFENGLFTIGIARQKHLAVGARPQCAQDFKAADLHDRMLTRTPRNRKFQTVFNAHGTRMP